jgi:hypothetical protein
MELIEGSTRLSGIRSIATSLPDPNTLKSALEEASGRPFTHGIVNAHRVAKKLNSIEGRPVEVVGKVYQLAIFRDH